jgi:hypothetical protein
VSVDVLEHIARPQRHRHLAELARVAREKIVVCCPLGGEEHEAAERELAAWHERTTGGQHRFLAEHIERGLPTAEDLSTLAGEAFGEHRLLYTGDFRASNAAFRAATELKAAPTPRLLARYLRAVWRLRGNHPLEHSPRATTNRVFIVGAPRPGMQRATGSG